MLSQEGPQAKAGATIQQPSTHMHTSPAKAEQARLHCAHSVGASMQAGWRPLS